MTNIATTSLRHLEEYALTISVCESDAKSPSPRNEPAQEVIEKMARTHILCQGIEAVAAFEVILFLKSNLKKKIQLENGTSCRLLGTADVLTIAKHAMGLLKSVFKPYAERLKKFSAVELREVCERVAGVYHREEVINIWTGSGISFTGISKFYYECSSLNKLEATKMLCGFTKDYEPNIYYLSRSLSGRGLQEMEAVVSSVLGVPGNRSN